MFMLSIYKQCIWALEKISLPEITHYTFFKEVIDRPYAFFYYKLFSSKLK